MNTFLAIHQEKDTAKRRYMLGTAQSLDVDFRINLRGLNQVRTAKRGVDQAPALGKFIPRANVDFKLNILQSI